jgi:ribosomal-protein-alanine N-acetyltransferase
MIAVADEGWRVRPMRSRHLPAILAIEQAAYLAPWSERIFRDCLRVGYRCWVIGRDEFTVAGYALASIAAGEAHLLNLCVAEAVRGQGASDRLLATVIAQARHEYAAELFLEVRPSNLPARRLYARHGFECRGRRRGYYPGRLRREDALVLARPVGS